MSHTWSNNNYMYTRAFYGTMLNDKELVDLLIKVHHDVSRQLSLRGHRVVGIEHLTEVVTVALQDAELEAVRYQELYRETKKKLDILEDLENSRENKLMRVE